MILVINREMMFANREQYLGGTGDGNSEERLFRIERVRSGADIAYLNFKLDLEYSNGSKDACALEKELSEEYVILHWNVYPTVMQIPGPIFANLRAYDDLGEVRWSSYRGVFYCEQSIDTPGEYKGKLTELEELEAVLDKKKKDAEDAAAAAESAKEAAEDIAETVQEAKETATDAAKTATAAAENANNSARKAEEAQELAEKAKEAAETAEKNAEAVAGVGIASTERAGIVKPDGKTLRVGDEGDLSVNMEVVMADRNLKTYTSLEQIGLTIGEETILDIAKNLPVSSELLITVSKTDGNVTSEYPSDYGALYARKAPYSSRVYLEFTKTVNAGSQNMQKWEGECNPDTDTWTGWNLTFNEANPPTPEQVGALPASNEGSTGENATDILTSGLHCRAVMIDDSNKDKGTPYSEGACGCTAYFIISYASSVGNGFQLAFPSGVIDARLFMRGCNNGTVGPWTTGHLPLSGGTLGGSVKIESESNWKSFIVTNAASGRQSSFTHGDNCLYMQTGAVDDNSNRSILVLNNESSALETMLRLVRKLDGSNEWFNIHGEHNKPKGTYTGNGDATSRTINTGGIGSFLIGNTPDNIFFVTPQGCVLFNRNTTTPIFFTSSQVKYANGIITLATSDARINGSGGVFGYYCL